MFGSVFKIIVVLAGDGVDKLKSIISWIAKLLIF
jgi:hypothetical protein